MTGNDTVDEYIAREARPAQLMMKQIRAAIRAVAPEAEERISYGMPFYEYKFQGVRGRLAYIGAHKKFISLQPLPHHIPADLEKKLGAYRAAKSTVRFPIGTRVPITLIRKLVRMRKDEIDAAK